MENPPLEPTVLSPQSALPPDPPTEVPTAPETSVLSIVGREGLLALATGVGYLLFWPLVRAISSGSMAVVAITTLLSLLLVRNILIF